MQYQDFGELYKPDTSLSLKKQNISPACQLLFFASGLRIRIKLVVNPNSAVGYKKKIYSVAHNGAFGEKKCKIENCSHFAS
jgi:hypothetical protein